MHSALGVELKITKNKLVADDGTFIYVFVNLQSIAYELNTSAFTRSSEIALDASIDSSDY